MNKMVNKEKIIKGVFTKVPFSIFEKMALPDLSIFYYHMISDDDVLHLKYLYGYKNSQQFEDDIDFIAKYFNPLSLYDLIDFVRNKEPLPPRSFLLTFDDGFKEMSEVVAPILIRKGVPATFFVCSAFIDNQNMYFKHKASVIVNSLITEKSLEKQKKIRTILDNYGIKHVDDQSAILSITYPAQKILDEIASVLDIEFDDYLRSHKPYLGSGQISNMIKQGFTFGAHSIDHPLYSTIPIKDQLDQTITSLKQVRNVFELDYGAFAFPHTDNGVSNEYFTELYKDKSVDITFGTGAMRSDSLPKHFQRVSLEKPVIPAKNILSLQLSRRIYRVLTRNNVISR